MWLSWYSAKPSCGDMDLQRTIGLETSPSPPSLGISCRRHTLWILSFVWTFISLSSLENKLIKLLSKFFLPLNLSWAVQCKASAFFAIKLLLFEKEYNYITENFWLNNVVEFFNYRDFMLSALVCLTRQWSMRLVCGWVAVLVVAEQSTSQVAVSAGVDHA